MNKEETSMTTKSTQPTQHKLTHKTPKGTPLTQPNNPLPYHTAYSQKPRVQKHMIPGEGRTKQSFKDECDINVIMRRYQKTGVLPMSQRLEPRYADITGVDFQSAMDLVANARTAFEELPASIRTRFENDPAKLLDFVHDEDNYAEAAELGLLDMKAVEARKAAAVVTHTPPVDKSTPTSTTPPVKE